MPELPEVQTIINTLVPRIVGLRIEKVDLRRTDIVTPGGFDLASALRGRMITALSRRGKRVVFTLEDQNRFYIHLGMSGRLTVVSPDQAEAAHTHLVVKFGHIELRFVDPRRFGGIWWLGTDDGEQRMGPEPLTLRAGELCRRLGKTQRAIKNALLDQTVVAGLGNIYVDESLFAAGIHPLTPSDALSREQISRLNRAIKSTLRKALKHRGSTLRDYVDGEGGKGAFQNLHLVYDRAKLPCRRCKTTILRIVLGGRSTCFCPKCQPKRVAIKRDVGDGTSRRRRRRPAPARKARG